MTGSQMLTLEQVAAKLQLDYTTVLRHVQNNIIPAVKVGARYRVDPDVLEKWIAQRHTHG